MIAQKTGEQNRLPNVLGHHVRHRRLEFAPQETQDKFQVQGGCNAWNDCERGAASLKRDRPSHQGDTGGGNDEIKTCQIDLVVRAFFQRILEDYSDVFHDKIPYGPPLKWQIDDEINTVPGKLRPWRSCDIRWSYYWSKGGSELVQAPTALPCFLFQRKTGNGAYVLTIGLWTRLQ